MVDIEVYDDDIWAQAKYLVHGVDDVFWTNDLAEALKFIKEQVKGEGNVA